MDLAKLVPAFRIEIRRAGSTEDEPWTVAELAHSENHVRAKMPFWKKNEDLETRVVPNFTTAVATLAAQESMPAPLTTPPAIVATAPAVIAPVVTGAAEAIAAASPALPFGPGDQLQDIHVAGHPPLFVDEINPGGRPGFSWTMPDHPIEANRQGFVGLTSVGNFEKVGNPVAVDLAASTPAPATDAPPAAAPATDDAEKKTE